MTRYGGARALDPPSLRQGEGRGEGPRDYTLNPPSVFGTAVFFSRT
jgi:hypothetical protein